MILSASARYVAAFVFLSAGAVCSLQAQTGGALTPDGAPGRTMKSLDQMEPRTPLIKGAPGAVLRDGGLKPDGAWEITESGSYYLVGNVTATLSDGIRLKANDITLDLRGYTITSVKITPAGAGILIKGNNIRIFNGHIASKTTYDPERVGNEFFGGGFNYGIQDDADATNVHIRDVSVRGCRLGGIVCNRSEVGASSLIESCTAHTIGGHGIVGVNVMNCVSRMCHGVGIYADYVSNSLGHSMDHFGIWAENTVSNCRGVSESSTVGWSGIRGHDISDSRGWSRAGPGIRSSGNVINCSGNTIATDIYMPGIDASGNISNSYGFAFRSSGIASGGSVINCRGVTGGTSVDAHGIQALGSVFNSEGITSGGRGIEAQIVGYSQGYTNGTSDNSDGIFALYNASYSFGRSDNVSGGDGVRTTIASFCTGVSDGTEADDVGIRATLAVGCIATGGEAIGTKHLMP